MFRKKIMLFALLGCMLMPANMMTQPQTVYAATADGSEISPQADSIDWQYSVRNGVLYKRLYNYTTDKPLSDWQIVT